MVRKKVSGAGCGKPTRESVAQKTVHVNPYIMYLDPQYPTLKRFWVLLV